MAKFINFSTREAATLYAKSRLGIVRRNLNGKGWTVETVSHERVPALTPKENSHSQLSPKIPDGWKVGKKGVYYKNTATGTYFVGKPQKGGWYLRQENTDLNGFCYTSPVLAIEKGNQIVNSKTPGHTPFPGLKIPEDRNILKSPQKVLPPPKPPVPAKQNKIIPKTNKKAMPNEMLKRILL